MYSEREDAANLLKGISQDIDRQIREMEDQAASYADSRRKAAEDQAREILRKADRSADAQCQAIARNAESKAAIERRKMALRTRDAVIQETLDRARELITESVDRPGYDTILLGWIVESAVGLSVPSATVNASREELPLITETLLREAEREAESFTGKPVRLGKAEGDPLPVQGVVLTAQDGHMAFNNQVPTRFLRAQTEIRKHIHAVLFDEGI